MHPAAKFWLSTVLIVSGCSSDTAPASPATDGETPVADGQTPVADGQTPVADGQTPVADAEIPASDGGAFDLAGDATVPADLRPAVDGPISCSDGRQNGSETDVDCGGSCTKKCAVNQACKVAADCASGKCSSTTHKCVSSLDLLFLGTGAATPECWIQHGRQLSSLLINRQLLIDFSCWTTGGVSPGQCGLTRLNAWGIDKNRITNVLITHHHDDHCDPAQLVALAKSRTSTTKLTVYGGVAVVNKIKANAEAAQRLNVKHLAPYTKVTIGSYQVTPLIAAHDSASNEPYVYVIEYYNKKMLYGTDSDRLSLISQSLQKLYSFKLNLVIRESTFATDQGYGHMCDAKNVAERKDLIAHQVISSSTPWYLTHIYTGASSASLPPIKAASDHLALSYPVP